METWLEPQLPEHAEGLFAALADPRIYTFLDEAPPPDVATLRRRLLHLQSGGPADGSERWLNWTVFHAGRIVGYTQATLRPDGTATIAYVLSPDVWGQGVAEAACRQMLTRLAEDHAPGRFLADTDVANTRSRRLLERLGFTLLREAGRDAFYAVDGAAFGPQPPR